MTSRTYFPLAFAVIVGQVLMILADAPALPFYALTLLFGVLTLLALIRKPDGRR